MSLNWDLTEVDNYKQVTDGPEWPVTDMVIWLTMFVGISTITDKNWPEFYSRAHLLELIDGGYLRADKQPRPITPDDIKRRIGLSTNASDWTRQQFLKNKIGSRLDSYSREVTSL